MMRLYLSSLSPWNSTYSSEEGHLLFKVEAAPEAVNGTRKIMLYRALPDVTLPTSERQLWEERHFFETHASAQREHPELDGQGSGFAPGDLILEESRDEHVAGALESDTSLYEFPLRYSSSSKRSPSPSRTLHSDTHPFWIAEHWVHFADIEYYQTRHSKSEFNVAGKVFTAEEFFEKQARQLKARTFTAWDGNKYMWDFKDRNVKLYRCADPASLDGHLLVAEYQGAQLANASVISKRRVTPPSLIIYPAGEPIIDLIIPTFVYGELCAREGSTGPPVGQRELQISGSRTTTLSLERTSTAPSSMYVAPMLQ